jgi:hypothetical protein
MYPQPVGTLPVTGANLLAFALAGGALMIAGIVTLRLVYFVRRGKGPARRSRHRGAGSR